MQTLSAGFHRKPTRKLKNTIAVFNTRHIRLLLRPNAISDFFQVTQYFLAITCRRPTGQGYFRPLSRVNWRRGGRDARDPRQHYRTRLARRAAHSAGFIIDEGGRGRLGTDARASGMPLPEVGRDQNHAPAGGVSGAAPAAQRRAGERSLRSGPERPCARLPRRGGTVKLRPHRPREAGGVGFKVSLSVPLGKV